MHAKQLISHKTTGSLNHGSFSHRQRRLASSLGGCLDSSPPPGAQVGQVANDPSQLRRASREPSLPLMVLAPLTAQPGL